MNCANHADASAVAYCRTCGKALCGNCTRPVRGVIYCEDCLGAKMETPPPPTAYQQVMDQGLGLKVAPGPASGPNPTVAGILGAIPLGIGAVYNGQYAKGLALMGIFALLIAGCNTSGDLVPTISGFGIAFLVLYGIIDSVRSARAIQAGLPPPDPYGLAATFGGGAPIEASKIPMGSIVLILLGVLFLLHTMGVGMGLDRFWPLILIVVGGWMFARNWGLMGPTGNAAVLKETLASRGHSVPMQNAVVAAACCQCARCRTRRIMGPAMVVTIGVLFLLQNLAVSDLPFRRTWPVILLVVGLVKLLQNSASLEGHIPPLAPGANPNPLGGPIPPVPPVPPSPPVPPVPPNSEVNRG
jgi:hypothetical protein